MPKLKQQLLVMTYGYPGSGKSFFASQFAEDYDMIYISEDRIRYELFEDPQFSDGENQVINRLMEYILNEALKSKVSIMYDGFNSNRKTRSDLIRKGNKAGIKTLMIWTQTDVDTSMMRSMNRDRRRPGDKYSFNLDEVTFSHLVSIMNAPKYEEYVVISGKYDYPAQHKTIRNRLIKMGLIDDDKPKSSRFQRPITTVQPNKRSSGGRRHFTV